MALTCLLRLGSCVKPCINSAKQSHILEEKNILALLSVQVNSPFLDRGFESMRISCHELVRLAEAELDRVVASVKWVVKGGLV